MTSEPDIDAAEQSAEEDTLRELRAILDRLPQDALDGIGVKLAPNPEDWQWVRECIVQAMADCGRRAARGLANFPFAGPSSTYSIALNKNLLAAIGRQFRNSQQEQNK